MLERCIYTFTIYGFIYRKAVMIPRWIPKIWVVYCRVALVKEVALTPCGQRFRPIVASNTCFLPTSPWVLGLHSWFRRQIEQWGSYTTGSHPCRYISCHSRLRSIVRMHSTHVVAVSLFLHTLQRPKNQLTRHVVSHLLTTAVVTTIIDLGNVSFTM